MAHIVRDFLAGSAIVAAGVILSLVATILLFFLWIFFHIVGALLCVVFFLFLCFAALWLVGFVYRKAGEMNAK